MCPILRLVWKGRATEGVYPFCDLGTPLEVTPPVLVPGTFGFFEWFILVNDELL